MRVFRVLVGLLLQTFFLAALAASPEIELRQMIEKDMVGDPSVRISMAAPKVAADLASNRELQQGHIAFDIDSDTLEIATNWRFDDKPMCSAYECVIAVVYRVVATTKGCGMPSWNKPYGREITSLEKPIERVVQYKLVHSGNKWKIVDFPMPYVRPEIMKEFFKSEYQKVESIRLPTNLDARALRNREVVRVWRLRQIEILEKLSL